MAAGGDQDVVGGVMARGDLNRVRVDEDRAALDDLDAAVLEHVDVDLLQPIELLVLGGDQNGPVEGWRGHGPAEAGRVGKRIGELRAIDEELFRHAAAQDAGAADAALLDDRDARAVAAGAARAGDAARAGADREQVEIIARHPGPLRCWVVLAPGCHNPRSTASGGKLTPIARISARRRRESNGGQGSAGRDARFRGRRHFPGPACRPGNDA